MLRRFASLHAASAIAWSQRTAPHETARGVRDGPVDLDKFVTHWRARGLEWPVVPIFVKGRRHSVTFNDTQPSWSTLIDKLLKFCTCPAQLTALGSAAPTKLRDSALKCYVKALQADEKHVEAWTLLGKLLGEAHSTATVRGTPVTRRECFYRALKCDPSQAVLWYNVGTSLEGDDRVTIGAEQNLTKKDCFLRALERNDSLAEAWNNLGLCLSEGESVRVKNDDVDAVGCFTKALCLDKTLPHSWSNLAWKLKARDRIDATCHAIDVDGTWYDQRGSIIKALRLSDSDRHSSTQASLDYCLLAELIENMTVNIKGTEVDQQLCWIRALEHDSTREEAWLRLGENLARSGSDSRAIIRGKKCSAVYCFARAVALNKKCRQAWLQLGLLQPLDEGDDNDEDHHDDDDDDDDEGKTDKAARIPKSVRHLSRSACFARALECQQSGYGPLWLLMAATMRDDEHVVVRGKRMNRAACFAMASEHAKHWLR
jgi:tetratricopeptide (TPR) repeat protein